MMTKQEAQDEIWRVYEKTLDKAARVYDETTDQAHKIRDESLKHIEDMKYDQE